MLKRLKNYKEFILTESIDEKDFEKATKIIVKYLNSKLGKIYQWPGIELIQKGSQEFKGIRYSTDDMKLFRINWKARI